jgi:catechol 2,3-dioxygenase-like lactoylglutathione lyase family enzyme
MFQAKAAFSGFSVDDLAKATAFYRETLGFNVTEEAAGMRLHLPGGSTVFVYPKADHQPATFTILNLVVEQIEAAVEALIQRGVQFEHYARAPQDAWGILRLSTHARPSSPPIAWFKDPAGNILAVIEEQVPSP